MPSPLHHEESDSEDDADYVPPANDGSSSEDEEKDHYVESDAAKSKVTEENKEAQKRARDALWASFQASIPQSSTPAPSSSAHAPELVKIEKRYRFAGEDVVEVKEVPEDSEDAKKWPRWWPESQLADPTPPQPAQHPSNSPQTDGSPSPSDTPNFQPSSSTIPQPSASASPATSTPKPAARKPGPRKPKASLPSLPGTRKPKKLSTLDKSAMDWQAAHARDEELEANRRGGGYLEKVEFLQRVEERRDGLLEAGRAGKRRKL